MQWLNEGIWLFLLSVPNYATLATEFSELFQPALTAIALFLPLTTFYPLFKWLYGSINDTNDIRDSIMDFGGISLANTKEGTGPYTCEVALCKDNDTGAIIKIPETRRYESLLVVGNSGSGKTSMIFEPMMARDMEKKHFFKEMSKEMGFTALKTGIASLNCPYDNEYINKNFNLNMLTPNPNKIALYKAYMKKMIYATAGDGKIIYRNLGITSVSPDYESTSRMIDVANNFNLKVNIIDPANPDSPGLNPFVYDDPSHTAIAISSVLRSMYATSHTDVEEAFHQNVAMQAIENISILLKEMYPRLHEDDLPNLSDILDMLNDFSLVEDMCHKLEEDPELKEQYKAQLAYFKKNFYQDGSAKADTEKYVYSATTQLDNLLRYSGVKNILCNRTNNINYDKALENGEITLVCTRRGDLGEATSKAFGLFFILLMQYSVLRRPGNESTRIPHFLYIDEFPDYICKATSSIFTLYRKYRVAPVISAQNLDQLGNKNNSKFRQTILSNCANKVVFGNNTPEDNEWWSAEFGTKRKWKFKNDYHTNPAKGEPGYDEKYAQIEWGWTEYFKPQKIQTLKFKNCAYKIRDIKGKSVIGPGSVDFLESKFKEPQDDKNYNFEKFTKGIAEDKHDTKRKHKNKVLGSDYKTDLRGDIDPIRTDESDTNFLLNNDDAIIYNLKKGNPNG